RLRDQAAARSETIAGGAEKICERAGRQVLEKLRTEHDVETLLLATAQPFERVGPRAAQPLGLDPPHHRRIEIETQGVDTCFGEQLEHLSPTATQIDSLFSGLEEWQVRAQALLDELLRTTEHVFETAVVGAAERRHRIEPEGGAAVGRLHVEQVRRSEIDPSRELERVALLFIRERIDPMREIA